MYTNYNQEQFSGTGSKERETYFWARYRFTAYNQGGLGPIEMSGFFYLSKAECYWQENKGVFVIFSPAYQIHRTIRTQMMRTQVRGSVKEAAVKVEEIQVFRTTLETPQEVGLWIGVQG